MFLSSVLEDSPTPTRHDKLEAVFSISMRERGKKNTNDVHNWQIINRRKVSAILD